jgi:hypothetical protein
MDTLQIKTSEVRLAVNGDAERVISFNPADTLFAEKFYRLSANVDAKLAEFTRKGKELDADKAAGENGMPLNLQARIELQRDLCLYLRDEIDALFGAGTSQNAFGAALEADAFPQFFEGITPYFQRARSEKVSQYTTDASAKRGRRKG